MNNPSKKLETKHISLTTIIVVIYYTIYCSMYEMIAYIAKRCLWARRAAGGR